MKYVKQSPWNELKKERFADYPLCKLCMIRPAVHLHHCIVSKGQVRNKRLHKYLNVQENALEVCGECHKTADGYMVRLKAWQIKCQEYGEDVMRTWYDRLPFVVKERY